MLTAPPQPPQWPRCRSLLHRHHGDKGVLGGLTPGGDGVGQHTRDDLPAQSPAVDAPAAFRRLPAIAYEWLAN